MILNKIFLFLLFFTIQSSMTHANSRWGADYFPNITLVTDEGKKVHFFDDLIKDKIVAINFIYTQCAEACPLETAQLVRVQKLLGDNLGKNVHFFSISIDPSVDNPEVLKQYKEKFNAKWTFLTGHKADIDLIRKKLGLYVEDIQDGSNNHNVNLIIGNQKTGQWMKRSPFENPHVLADQLGNWLNGWQQPPKMDTYANAPELRNISRGEELFRTRCANCHTISGNEAENALGPDLLGVTKIREKQWLLDWLKAPEKMLASSDPIAVRLFEKYNKLAMPNLRLRKDDALEILKFLDNSTN